jgi:hypothetical protein
VPYSIHEDAIKHWKAQMLLSSQPCPATIQKDEPKKHAVNKSDDEPEDGETVDEEPSGKGVETFDEESSGAGESRTEDSEVEEITVLQEESDEQHLGMHQQIVHKLWSFSTLAREKVKK